MPLKDFGVMTFSQGEMAFNILSLMTPAIACICDDGPIYADLNGCLQFVDDLKEKLTSARANIMELSGTRKALHAETVIERTILHGEGPKDPPQRRHRSTLEIGFPALSEYSAVTADCEDLRGMVDIRRTVVVVGYSDLSPWEAREPGGKWSTGEILPRGIYRDGMDHGISQALRGRDQGSTSCRMG